MKHLIITIITNSIISLALMGCGKTGDDFSPRNTLMRNANGTVSAPAPVEEPAVLDLPEDSTFLTMDVEEITSITLSWDNILDQEISGYVLAYQEGEIAPANCRLGTTLDIPYDSSEEVVTAVVDGLIPTTTYAFRLCVVGSDGNSLSRGVTLIASTDSPEIIDIRLFVDDPEATRREGGNISTAYINAPSGLDLEFYYAYADQSCEDETVRPLTVAFNTYQVGSESYDLYSFEVDSLEADLRNYWTRTNPKYRFCIKHNGEFATGVAYAFKREEGSKYTNHISGAIYRYETTPAYIQMTRF